jgi:hypothetical protein
MLSNVNIISDTLAMILKSNIQSEDEIRLIVEDLKKRWPYVFSTVIKQFAKQFARIVLEDELNQPEEKEEKIYRLGDKFKYAGGTVMLSSAGVGEYALINIDKANEGCRAGDPVDLGSEKYIFTEQELTTIAGTLRPYMTLIEEETNND